MSEKEWSVAAGAVAHQRNVGSCRSDGRSGPKTPLIKLPPEIGKNTPPIEVHAISHYDKDGPFWAWNWLKLGEHSGTHFDAPVHWITGKDYPDGTTDTHPGARISSRRPVSSIAQGSGDRTRFSAHRRRREGLGEDARRRSSPTAGW